MNRPWYGEDPSLSRLVCGKEIGGETCLGFGNPTALQLYIYKTPPTPQFVGVGTDLVGGWYGIQVYLLYMQNIGSWPVKSEGQALNITQKQG